ncbi:solute carrier family 22 member 7-like [Haemaphysalis longicornis]
MEEEAAEEERASCVFAALAQQEAALDSGLAQRKKQASIRTVQHPGMLKLLFPDHLIPPIDVQTSDGFDCGDAYGHGYFQGRNILITVVFVWLMHSHTLAFPLVSGDLDHWCKQPEGLNISAAEWKAMAVPLEDDGGYSQCTVYAEPGDPNDTRVKTCDQWDYDTELVHSSIVSSWNMVCGRSWRISMCNAVFMAGAVSFLAVSGYIADAKGRKPVARIIGMVLVVSTLGCCFPASYMVYVCNRFFISGSSSVLSTLGLVLLHELSADEHRAVHVAGSFLVGLTFGDVVFNTIKQVERLDWVTRQLILVAPTLLLPPAFIVMVESPRWLVAARRLEDALRVMVSAARANDFPADGVTRILKVAEYRLHNAPVVGGAAQADGVPTAEIVQRRAAIMFVSSFSVLFFYYSVVLTSANSGVKWLWWSELAFTVVACLLLRWLFKRITRVRLLAGAYLLAGTSSSLVSLASFFDRGPTGTVVHSSALVLAWGSAVVAVAAHFPYCLELFPTPVRAAGMCLSSASSRLGGVFASLMYLLHGEGREDLLFALTAIAVYGSAGAFRWLPPEASDRADSTRESHAASDAQSLVSDSKRRLVDEMKRTLEQPVSYSRISKKRQSTVSKSSLEKSVVVNSRSCTPDGRAR